MGRRFDASSDCDFKRRRHGVIGSIVWTAFTKASYLLHKITSDGKLDFMQSLIFLSWKTAITVLKHLIGKKRIS